jgi:hypothetical protein
MKRFMIAFIAASIFIVVWGWFFNGVLLKDASADVQSLFRPREEIMSLFYWIIIGQAGLALAFVMILREWFRHWRNRGRRSAWNHAGNSGDRRALRDLRNAAISGTASRADQHRRLHRDDRDWRNCWCDL